MNGIQNLIEQVMEQYPEIHFRTAEPMAKHTSFRIGGPVKVMFFPDSQEQMVSLCRLAQSCDVRPLIIGNGTNLLVSDAPLDIAVIKTSGGLSRISCSETGEITAGSGVSLSRLSVFAMEHGLTGLEFAHGIPGTLGGAVYMNAGAYGGEMADVVVTTTYLDESIVLRTVCGNDHDFAYRHSRFSDTRCVLLASVLRLLPGEKRAICGRMEELSQKRRASQPLNLPSAGSTFKRPMTGYAAAMIDGAGLKGYTYGGAQVSEKHAGFVVNLGGASFDDVCRVMEHVQETVFKQYGTVLEPEVKIIR
jgi:UDP-N-acetylmuramate dehydrogenase